MASSSSPSTSAAAYEAHLTSLSLEELTGEPGLLQTQAHHLTSSLTSLTHSSYPTFLSLHESTNALSKSLSSFSDSLSSLVSKSLPALQKATAAWQTETTDILKERGKARQVLEQHDKLKDLLDVPTFIDSCVRSGNFQEALQLANHVEHLATRPDAPPIIKSIHVEVEVAIAQMLVALLGTLHEEGRKLPALWKAVNTLRKMRVFEDETTRNLHGQQSAEHERDPISGEELLALSFLSGRLSCLSTNLSSAKRDITRLTRGLDPGTSEAPVDYTLSNRDKDDVARFLKKYIDAWRENAYDVVTQFSSIFLEHQSHTQTTLSAPSIARRPSQQQTPVSPQPASNHGVAARLIPYLCSHLLSHLIPLLESTLPLLSLPLLPSILTQLTYCATAFTRVGMDFRAIVGGIISSAVLAAVHRDLQNIKSVLNPGQITSLKAGKTPSEWLVSPSARESLPSIPSLDTLKRLPAHVPPQAIASFPPLAIFTNSLLGVLNSLRLLAPLNIVHDLVAELDAILGENGEKLARYLAPHLTATEDTKLVDAKVARVAGDAYFGVVVPFMRRALVEGVYGEQVASLSETDDQAHTTTSLFRIVDEWEKFKT